jgi:6-pyruvoyltetrahydropterin/6-carboxytetrahydropterin synthase
VPVTTTLTRRYRFSAVHMLARRDWTEERNRAVYGKCANRAGHGHDYGIEVTLRGEVEPESGLLAPVEEIDRAVRSRVLDRVDCRDLNRDLPEFAQVVPTAENIARFVWGALVDHVPRGVLHRVRVIETPRNSAACSGGLEER